jgi:hypothetical protein
VLSKHSVSQQDVAETTPPRFLLEPADSVVTPITRRSYRISTTGDDSGTARSRCTGRSPSATSPTPTHDASTTRAALHPPHNRTALTPPHPRHPRRARWCSTSYTVIAQGRAVAPEQTPMCAPK